jgi:hypothetical protein
MVEGGVHQGLATHDAHVSNVQLFGPGAILITVIIPGSIACEVSVVETIATLASKVTIVGYVKFNVVNKQRLHVYPGS